MSKAVRSLLECPTPPRPKNARMVCFSDPVTKCHTSAAAEEYRCFAERHRQEAARRKALRIQAMIEGVIPLQNLLSRVIEDG